MKKIIIILVLVVINFSVASSKPITAKAGSKTAPAKTNSLIKNVKKDNFSHVTLKKSGNKTGIKTFEYPIPSTSAIIAISAMIVSLVALIYTVKTYILKSGTNIRGSYGKCSSSIYSDDQYVTNVTLENLKDRAIAIFEIYLKIGHNYFLEIETFDDQPLILKPFEVFYKEYDPIDLYSYGMSRIDLNKLLSNEKIKKQLVLSTSDGKYVVTSWIKRWNPIYDFFDNHLITVIQSCRTKYKGKSYGINVKYIVDIKMENGKEETIPIYPEDYKRKNFKKFNLSKESLDSKESLEEFLYEQVGNGLLNCKEITVHDFSVWRDEIYESENEKTIKAEYCNWFVYNFIGPLYTKLSDFRFHRKNRLAKRSLKNRNT